MTKHVISVTPKTSAEVCAKLMIENKIGSVLVVNEDGKTVGIITKENLIKHVIAQNAAPETVKAFEIMTSPVITAKPSMTLIQAMQKMFRERIRHLVIADADRKAIGIVTDTDIFRVVPALLLIEQEYLKIVESEKAEGKEDFVSGYCDDCKEFSEYLRFVDGKYLCPNCIPEDYITIEEEESIE